MVVLDASIVTIALPSAQRALHISVANRQWVITAYTVAFGGLLLLGGRIADFGGRRRMFIVGSIGFAGASALGGLAANQAMLFGARALQGAFAALMAPAALSILTITFQADPRGTGQGIWRLWRGIRGGRRHRRAGRRDPHGVRLVAVVPADQRSHCPAGGRRGVANHHREPGARARRAYDIPGALLSTAGLVCLVYGFTKADTDGWASTPTVVFICPGGGAAGVVRAGGGPLQPSAAAAAGRRRAQPGRCVLATLLTGGRPVRHVRLPELLLPAGAALLGPEGRASPSCRSRPGIVLAAGASTAVVPRVGPRLPMTVGLLAGAVGPGVADTDRRAHLVLDPCPAAPDPDERRARAWPSPPSAARP